MHISRSTLALAVTATVASLFEAADASSVPGGLTKCLESIKGDKRSRLVTPASSDYDEDRALFNSVFNSKPADIYHPATNEDAAAAIKCAVANNVPIAPRSGGHSYEGYGNGGKDGYLVIDLQLMQQYALNKKTLVATIGAGSLLGPIYSNLWSDGGYLISAGSCPTVGIGGHALGGGYGVVSRKYGFAADNVLEMTFIDYRGEIMVVNQTSNSDLFWALRGAGGGGYGLVTEFKMQAYKASKNVTTVDLSYSSGRYSRLMDALAQVATTIPDELVLELVISPGVLDVQGTYLGPRDEAMAALANITDIAGQPDLGTEINDGTWYDAATRWSYLDKGYVLANASLDYQPTAEKGRSLMYRKPLSKEERDIIDRYITDTPPEAPGTYIILSVWGGKMNRPDRPAAFDNHRGVRYTMQFMSGWQPNSTCEACLQWSSNFAKDLQKAYSSGPLEAYQNYIESDMPDSLHTYYGKSLSRLQEIKATVDPKNVFRNAQSITLPS